MKRLSSKYAKLILLEALVIASFTLIVEDLNTEYTWIYPLNTPRDVTSLYAKSSITIALVDAEAERRSIVVLSGLLASSVISECSTCYAVVIASGVNYYTLLFVIALTFSTGLAIYTWGVTRPLVILLVVMYIVAYTIMHSYIKEGSSVAYSVEESRLGPVRVDSLEYMGTRTVLLELGNSSWLITSRHVYGFRDRVRDSSLIAVRVRRAGDEDVTIRINTSKSSLEAPGSIALYVDRGEVEVLVLVDKRPANSEVEYYKLEFTPRETQAELHLTVTLILVAAQCSLITIRSLRGITMKAKRPLRS